LGQKPLVGAPFGIKLDVDGWAFATAERWFIVDRNEETLKRADALDRFQLINLRNILHLSASKPKTDVLAANAATFLIPADKTGWRALRHWLDLSDGVRNDGKAYWAVRVNVTGVQKSQRKVAVNGDKTAHKQPKYDQKPKFNGFGFRHVWPIYLGIPKWNAIVERL